MIVLLAIGYVLSPFFDAFQSYRTPILICAGVLLFVVAGIRLQMRLDALNAIDIDTAVRYENARMELIVTNRGRRAKFYGQVLSVNGEERTWPVAWGADGKASTRIPHGHRRSIVLGSATSNEQHTNMWVRVYGVGLAVSDTFGNIDHRIHQWLEGTDPVEIVVRVSCDTGSAYIDVPIRVDLTPEGVTALPLVEPPARPYLTGVEISLEVQQ